MSGQLTCLSSMSHLCSQYLTVIILIRGIGGEQDTHTSQQTYRKPGWKITQKVTNRSRPGMADTCFVSPGIWGSVSADKGPEPSLHGLSPPPAPSHGKARWGRAWRGVCNVYECSYVKFTRSLLACFIFTLLNVWLIGELLK